MIDIYTSRRDCHLECIYFSQIKNNDIIPNNQIAYSSEPTGVFYAKEASSYMIQNQQVENSFLTEQFTITIYTRDNIKNLARNDIVIVDGDRYRVAEIQVVPVKKQRGFINKEFASNGYYIALRK